MRDQIHPLWTIRWLRDINSGQTSRLQRTCSVGSLAPKIKILQQDGPNILAPVLESLKTRHDQCVILFPFDTKSLSNPLISTRICHHAVENHAQQSNSPEPLEIPLLIVYSRGLRHLVYLSTWFIYLVYWCLLGTMINHNRDSCG